jgi:hypothetical protein
VQIGGLRHEVQPTARAIRERFGLIAEVLGVAAVEEGGEVQLGPRPSRQPPHRPSDTRQRRGVVLNARQAHGDPERQPIRADAVTREPAQVGRFDKGEPVPPALRPTPQPIVQRTEPTCDAGEPGGMARLGLPPVFENRSLSWFCPWPGRQIVGLLLHRGGQVPQIVVVCLLDSFDTSERIVENIMQSRCLRFDMCKILPFCSLPKGFLGVAPHSFT